MLLLQLRRPSSWAAATGAIAVIFAAAFLQLLLLAIASVCAQPYPHTQRPYTKGRDLILLSMVELPAGHYYTYDTSHGRWMVGGACPEDTWSDAGANSPAQCTLSVPAGWYSDGATNGPCASGTWSQRTAQVHTAVHSVGKTEAKAIGYCRHDSVPSRLCDKCSGDCDKDADCHGTMKCFQRAHDEPVPGCDTVGMISAWDYCYSQQHGDASDENASSTLEREVTNRKTAYCDFQVPAGHFADGVSNGACPAGTWGSVGATDKAHCTMEVPPGHFNDGITAGKCPAGTWSNATTDVTMQNNTVCDCKTGAYKVPCTCMACPAGTWSDEAATSLAQCTLHVPPGHFNDGVTIPLTSPNMDVASRFTCSAGTWSLGANVTSASRCTLVVPAGSYNNGVTASPCPAGTWSFEGATHESNCTKRISAGHWNNGSMSMMGPCPKGSWSLPGATQEAECSYQIPSGYFNDGTKSGPCPVGKWSRPGATSHLQCLFSLSPGHFNDGLGNLGVCPTGTWSKLGATQMSQCRQELSSGHWNNGSAVGVCPAGTWSNEGATNATSCTLPIPAGHYNDGTTVGTCPIGTWSADSVRTFVAALGNGRYGFPNGTYTFAKVPGSPTFLSRSSNVNNNYSSLMIQECQKFGMKPVCDEPSRCRLDKNALYMGNNGYVSMWGHRKINSWYPSGWSRIKTNWDGLCVYAAWPSNPHGNAYCNLPISTHAWSSPSQYNPGFVCGKAGRYTSKTNHGATMGARNATQCILASPGFYRNATNSKPCPVGTWSLGGYVTSATQCGMIVPDGHFNDGWTPGTCPAGTWSARGANSVSQCTVELSAGRWNDGTLTGICPPGTWSTAGATRKSQCATKLSAGSYNDGTTAKACPRGKWSVAGATSYKNCSQKAPAGYFSDGAESRVCPSGTWSDAGASSKSQCNSVQRGRWNNGVSSGVCPPGTMSELRATSKSDCRRELSGGYFNNGTVLGVGICPVGTWSPLGATDISQCTSSQWPGRWARSPWTHKECRTSKHSCGQCSTYYQTPYCAKSIARFTSFAAAKSACWFQGTCSGVWFSGKAVGNWYLCNGKGVHKYSDGYDYARSEKAYGKDCYYPKPSWGAGTARAACSAGTWPKRGATKSSDCGICSAGKWSDPAMSIPCVLKVPGGHWNDGKQLGVCPVGTWSKPGGTGVAHCKLQVPAGWYSDGFLTGACPPGTWSATGAVVASQCLLSVPAGYFADGVRNGACPVGTWGAAGATSKIQCELQVPPGHFNDGTNAGPCPAGTYSNAGFHLQAALCTDTPGFVDAFGTCAMYEARQWCTRSGSTGSAWQPSWGALDPAVVGACCACGKKMPTKTCTTCVAGMMSIMGSISVATNASQCTRQLSAGHWNDGTTAGTCPAGTWSAAGATSQRQCKACPAGKWSSEGAGSERHCTLSAPAGYFNDGTSTGVCPAGTWGAPGATDVAQCTVDLSPGHWNDGRVAKACPRGRWSAAGATSKLDCHVKDAPAGFYSDGVTNGLCPVGMWCQAGAINANQCAQIVPPGHYNSGRAVGTCPPGTWGSAGAISKAHCTLLVPAGHYNDGTLAAPCPRGSWSVAGAVSAKQCTSALSEGHYNDGTTANACPIGTWSRRGATVEAQCTLQIPEGHFNDGVTAGACPVGMWSRAGSLGKSQCTVHLSRGHVTPCPAGKYGGDGYKGCRDCPEGTWSNTWNSSITRCFACSVATWSKAGTGNISQCTRLLSPGHWNDGTKFGTCPKGRWSAEGAVSARQCTLSVPDGYHNDGRRAGPCPARSWSISGSGCSGSYLPGHFNDGATPETCAPGTWSPPGAIDASQCTRQLSAGHWNDGTTAGTCPAGTWSAAGATSQRQCKACPAGKWSSEGAGSERHCTLSAPAGYFNDGTSTGVCPAGTWGAPGATDVAQCTVDLSPGHWNDGRVAKACPRGRWSAAGARSSAKCTARSPAGHYNNGAAAGPCPAGTWSSVGYTSCAMCPVGRWSSTVSATSATACMYCPLGTWSRDTGGSSERSCKSLPGYYNDGFKTAGICPRGKWSNVRAPTPSPTPYPGSFTVRLGNGRYGVRAATYTFISRKLLSTAGKYSDLMIQACRAVGMKPVCDHPSYCRNDINSLYIGQYTHIGDTPSRDSKKRSWFPLGWSSIARRWVGLCNYANQVRGHVNDAICNIPSSKYVWANPTQFNPGFMCGSGHAAAGATMVSECNMEPPAGHYNSGKYAGVCPAGHVTDTYAKPGAIKCSACPAARYSPVPTTTCQPCVAYATCPSGSSSIMDCQCRVGYSSVVPKHTPGPALNRGKRQLRDNQYDTKQPRRLFAAVVTHMRAPTPLPTPRFASAGPARECAACPSGLYDDDHNGTTTCVACPKGYQTGKSNGASRCSQCPSGYFDHDRHAGTKCIPCGPAGHVTDSPFTCTPCAAGKYSMHPSQPCTACPEGATSPPGSAGIFMCRCKPGFSGPSARMCTPCPPGSVTDALAGLGALHCTPCAAGYFSLTSTTPCTLCPPGHITNTLDGAGASVCKRCSASGMYDDDLSASSSCRTCPEHSVLDQSLPTVSKCVDSPSGWTSTHGYTCSDFVNKKLCTASGGYGEGWKSVWQSFARLASVNGITAPHACCGCGGGSSYQVHTIDQCTCDDYSYDSIPGPGVHCTHRAHGFNFSKDSTCQLNRFDFGFHEAINVTPGQGATAQVGAMLQFIGGVTSTELYAANFNGFCEVLLRSYLGDGSICSKRYKLFGKLSTPKHPVFLGDVTINCYGAIHLSFTITRYSMGRIMSRTLPLLRSIVCLTVVVRATGIAGYLDMFVLLKMCTQPCIQEPGTGCCWVPGVVAHLFPCCKAFHCCPDQQRRIAPPPPAPVGCYDQHSSCKKLKGIFDAQNWSCFTVDMGAASDDPIYKGKHLVDECCASCHANATANATVAVPPKVVSPTSCATAALCTKCTTKGNSITDCQSFGLDCACVCAASSPCGRCMTKHNTRVDCESFGLDCTCAGGGAAGPGSRRRALGQRRANALAPQARPAVSLSTKTNQPHTARRATQVSASAAVNVMRTSSATKRLQILMKCLSAKHDGLLQSAACL